MRLHFSDPNLPDKELTIRLLRSGKVIVKLGEGDVHYTLHPGTFSGTVDVHKSDERFPEGDARRYETLKTFKKAAISRALSGIGPDPIIEFWRLWRRLRLGWMVRRRLGIGPRLPSDGLGVDAISVKRGPSGCDDALASWMKPPEFYDEVLDSPDTAYLLFDSKKPSSALYGVMFTYRGRDGFVRMRWVRSRDLRRWVTKWEPVFLEAWHRVE
jgi:hypothetical protein